MAFVTYHGEYPADQDFIVHHGYEFRDGDAVEVEDKALLKRFEGNRFFRVSDSEKEDNEAEAVELKEWLDLRGIEYRANASLNISGSAAVTIPVLQYGHSPGVSLAGITGTATSIGGPPLALGADHRRRAPFCLVSGAGLTPATDLKRAWRMPVAPSPMGYIYTADLGDSVASHSASVG